MTQIRAKTLELLENLSDEKLIYVFNILQNLEAFSQNGEMRDAQPSKDAFSTLMKYSRSLPEDFDYKAELVAAREERYDAFTDFEDCLQMECALEIGAEYIITRNLSDYANSEIPAIEPRSFLEDI